MKTRQYTAEENERYFGFLWGFGLALDVDQPEAREQWAGFSRQMSDSQRHRIEQQGQDAGFEQGQAFRKLHP